MIFRLWVFRNLFILARTLYFHHFSAISSSHFYFSSWKVSRDKTRDVFASSPLLTFICGPTPLFVFLFTTTLWKQQINYFQSDPYPAFRAFSVSSNLYFFFIFSFDGEKERKRKKKKERNLVNFLFLEWTQWILWDQSRVQKNRLFISLGELSERRLDSKSDIQIQTWIVSKIF